LAIKAADKVAVAQHKRFLTIITYKRKHYRGIKYILLLLDATT